MATYVTSLNVNGKIVVETTVDASSDEGKALVARYWARCSVKPGETIYYYTVDGKELISVFGEPVAFFNLLDALEGLS